MNRNLKISITLIAVFAVVVAAIAVASGGGDDDEATREARTAATQPATTSDKPPASQARVVAADPRTLGRPGNSGVTFTEFLDFECEACGAAFPAVEQLRRQYAGRVTFNMRYFPLPSHPNARPAAHAVEAAARQGKLEAMYKRMFETQSEWADKGGNRAPLFRSFAEELGLDMKAFDAAVTDSKTAARVERDVRAGQALGVDSTPTFFINEKRIEPQSIDDLRRLLDEALQGT